MEDFIFYLIISILILIFLFLINKSSNKEIEFNKNETVTFRMNKFYLYFGIIGLFIGLISSISIFLNERDFLLAITFFTMFSSSGLFLVLMYKNHQITTLENKIEIFNTIGKKKTIHWEEIKDVKFDFFKGNLTLKDGNGEKLKINQHIVGFKSIIQILKDKTKINFETIKLP
jgi:hypothetical protein